MQHVDDGQLHALLDGELEPVEVTGLEEHLAGCEECTRRVDEARLLVGEADGLIASLDDELVTPARPAGARTSGRAPLESIAPPERDSVGGGPPDSVILIPPPPETPRPRRPGGRMMPLVWAASIAVVIGGGYLATTRLRPDAERQEMSGPVTLDAPAVARSTVSETELAPQTPSRFLTDTFAFAVDSSLASAAAETAMTKATTEPVEVAAAPPPRPAPTPPARQEPRPERAAGRLAEAADEAADEPAVDRADAARATAAVPAPAAPAPADNLERRSGIYQRVGLDEAQRLLAGPVHVLDGLGRPQFTGLVSGVEMPNGDPNRPVVRVVYLDQAQRLILLDQQRVGLGDDAGGTDVSVSRDGAMSVATWVEGNVRFALRGPVSESEIRGLVRRVR